jgi:hypothetical protein
VKLQVNEADGTDAIRILDSVGSIHQLNLTTGSIIASRSSGSNGGLTIGTANQTWGATGGFLALNTNGSTRLHITSGGAVGIGTATPQSLLDVNLGSSGVHATFGYVAGRGLELSIDAAASTGGAGVVYNAKGGGVSGTHIFQTDNNERCRLTADGKLLVGTSSARSNFSGTDTPQFQVEGTTFNTSTISVASASSLGGGNIELAGTGTATVGNTGTVSNNGYLGSIHFLGGDGTNLRKGAAIDCQVDGTPGTNDMPGRLVFSTCPDGSASPTERMRITNGGNVLIGCQSLPSATVEGFVATGTSSGNRTSSGSSTSAYNHWVFYNGNGIVGSISTSASATTYATSSDYRLKENVVPLTGAADRVKQLQVHRFNFIADPDTTVDGFLAHEAQAVVPECVTGTKDAVDADGNPVYQGIDQSKLVPLLTAALQEALAEIESLRARLDAAGI